MSLLCSFHLCLRRSVAVTVKALTIRQPWAWAILWAGKDIENRTWLPNRKLLKPGDRFAIHASLKPADDFDGAISRIRAIVGRDHHLPLPRWKDLPRGAIIGTAVFLAALAGWDPPSPWAEPDAYHWSIGGVVPLGRPEPCPARVGVWEVPREIVRTRGLE